jgi:hypothetical protein
MTPKFIVPGIDTTNMDDAEALKQLRKESKNGSHINWRVGDLALMLRESNKEHYSDAWLADEIGMTATALSNCIRVAAGVPYELRVEVFPYLKRITWTHSLHAVSFIDVRYPRYPTLTGVKKVEWMAKALMHAQDEELSTRAFLAWLRREDENPPPPPPDWTMTKTVAGGVMQAIIAAVGKHAFPDNLYEIEIEFRGRIAKK